MDAHTVYDLPNGYGSVYFATPFSVRSRVVTGVQRFFTGVSPYPFALWVSVCGANCPFNTSMYGWEITAINGASVFDFIKSFSRGSGTYYDEGARANAFISGFLWGQSSLAYNPMPPPTFNVTLTAPSTHHTTTITLPFAFGGSYGAWNRTSMMNANRHSNSARGSAGPHELFSERLLLDSMHQHYSNLRKRSNYRQDELADVEASISELTLYLEQIRVDLLHAKAILHRDGFKALLDDGTLPFIPSPRQRVEHVLSLQQALWAHDMDFSVKEEANEDYLAAESITLPQFARSSSISAGIRPIIRGNSSYWKLHTQYKGITSTPTNYFESLSAYYGSYRNTSILRLHSFSHRDGHWVESMKNATSKREENGLNDNLIIDVTNNGGGSVCLNFDSLSYLVNAWSNFTAVAGSDTLFSVYDIRKSEMLAALYDAGIFHKTDAFNISTGAFLGTSYYCNSVNRTIGTKTSAYTQPFIWHPCGKINHHFPNISSYHFDKIIILTDGRCGSSCAYFVSQLREADKVRIVSYGGLHNQPMSSVAFAGGNVFSWSYIESVASNLPENPYSSYIAVSVRENFSFDKYPDVPRQFVRLEADWHLPIWNSLWRFYNAPNVNITARYALYESILPLFDEMPSGLPRAPRFATVVPDNEPYIETSDPSTMPSSLPTSMPNVAEDAPENVISPISAQPIVPPTETAQNPLESPQPLSPTSPSLIPPTQESGSSPLDAPKSAAIIPVTSSFTSTAWNIHYSVYLLLYLFVLW